MTHPTLLGLQGWQWVYIAWGIPAVVLGVLVLFWMTDRPAEARWLTDEEKRALSNALARERHEAEASGGHNFSSLVGALRDARVWLLGAVNFAIVTGHYGVEMFLPSILKQWYGLSLDHTTWVVIVPFIAMLLGQLLVSHSSDRTGERWWHTAAPMFIGGAALALTPLTAGMLPLTLLGFAIAMAGIRSYLPPFYALPRLFLGGTAAAGAIGLINAIGNLGGAVSPYVVGHIEKATGSFRGGLVALSGTALLAGLLVVVLQQWHLRVERRRTAGAG